PSFRARFAACSSPRATRASRASRRLKGGGSGRARDREGTRTDASHIATTETYTLHRHDALPISVIQGTVRRLLSAAGDARVAGVETMEGRRFGARAVVITTGTFLRGRIP